MTPIAEVERALSGVAAIDALCMVALPAEVGSLEARVGADGVFWSRGFELAGAGATATLVAAGESRFSDLARRGTALLERVRVVSLAPGAPPPRLIGGFSFHARRPSPEWQPFGEALFVLPRLAFVREAGRSWVCRTLSAAELADGALRDRALDELGRALEPASSPAPLARGPRPPRERDRDPDFLALVEAIGRGIDAGDFVKVVAARSAELELDAPLDLGRLLASLPAGLTRFALVREGRAFVGASPEQLVDKRGLDVRTEALAGSARANDSDALSRLLSSDKESAEHAIVRDAIVRSLAELGSVRAAERPDLRSLRHVAHLSTPIRARLRSACHVLELVERLHPTPAVGGEPRRRALDFLVREERIDRGWYAAPFGWFDAAGDGELCVALRSGLLSGTRARLYAGAGIVRGSEARAELAETELKLAALRELLEAPG